MKVPFARVLDSGGFILGSLLTWLVLYWAVRFTLEAHPEMADGRRLALSFLPAPVFALFLVLFVASLRRADELERRIQLEALAVAFPLGLLLLTTLALVQRARELDPQNWSYNHVWPMFAFFYLFGLMFARRRYA
jgi:hypothetical protein